MEYFGIEAHFGGLFFDGNCKYFIIFRFIIKISEIKILETFDNLANKS